MLFINKIPPCHMISSEPIAGSPAKGSHIHPVCEIMAFFFLGTGGDRHTKLYGEMCNESGILLLLFLGISTKFGDNIEHFKILKGISIAFFKQSYE